MECLVECSYQYLTAIDLAKCPFGVCTVWSLQHNWIFHYFVGSVVGSRHLVFCQLNRWDLPINVVRMWLCSRHKQINRRAGVVATVLRVASVPAAACWAVQLCAAIVTCELIEAQWNGCCWRVVIAHLGKTPGLQNSEGQSYFHLGYSCGNCFIWLMRACTSKLWSVWSCVSVRWTLLGCLVCLMSAVTVVSR